MGSDMGSKCQDSPIFGRTGGTVITPTWLRHVPGFLKGGGVQGSLALFFSPPPLNKQKNIVDVNQTTRTVQLLLHRLGLKPKQGFEGTEKQENTIAYFS